MQNHWYLKERTGIEGPFSEPEIRARLLSRAYGAGAEVKQGESNWRSADEVTLLFEKVYKDGWYVKTKGTTVGPFVTHKILDLYHTGKLPKNAAVRQGAASGWMPVSEMVAATEQKQSLLKQLTLTLQQSPSIAAEGDTERSREDVKAESVEPAIIPSSLRKTDKQTASPEPAELRAIEAVKIEPQPERQQIAAPKPMVVSPKPSPKPVILSPRPKPVVSKEAPQENLFQNLQIPVPTDFQPLQVNYDFSAPLAAKRPQVKKHVDPFERMIWKCFAAMLAVPLISRLLVVIFSLGTMLVAPPLLPVVIGVFIVVEMFAFCAFLAVGCATSVWGIIIPFQESPGQGLMCLFVPFYSLYYFITRWDRCWAVMLLSAGLALWLTLIFYFVFFITVPYAAIVIIAVVAYPDARRADTRTEYVY